MDQFKISEWEVVQGASVIVNVTSCMTQASEK